MKSRTILLILLLACQLAHVAASAWMLLAIIAGSPKALRIALSYDKLANVATGGIPTETISKRAFRGTQEGNKGWCILCKLLDYIDKGHCANSK